MEGRKGILRKGMPIPVAKAEAYGGTNQGRIANLVNKFGLMGRDLKEAVHTNDPVSMFMIGAEEGAKEIGLIFDLGGVYPIGEMWVWNYNHYDAKSPDAAYVNRGFKNVRIFYSVDRNYWIELKGTGYPYRFAKADGSADCKATNLDDGERSPVDFGGVSARYVKIASDPVSGVGNWGGKDGGESLFGLSKVLFFAGEGLIVEPAPEWSNLFKRYTGWTGSDGIFTIPFSGVDAPGTAHLTKTLFLFSDTFIGDVDEETGRRGPAFKMINNSMAILDGGRPDPAAIRFIWGENGDYTIDSVLKPTTPKSKEVPDDEDNDSGYYYWLQDGICINKKIYILGLLVRNTKSGPEGFRFAVDGATLITIPVGPNGPELDKQTQADAPVMYRNRETGVSVCFGAGIMPNTREAGAPNPDGYIYIYGYGGKMFERNLLVARVEPDKFADFGSWRYWDGKEWSPKIEDAAPIGKDYSNEMSVTPISDGLYKGKYMMIFQVATKSELVACSIADSPTGPFDRIQPLYHCPEPDEGWNQFTYNAKAHPHLSGRGELLVTYNVNTASWIGHVMGGHIYRPRWIRLIDNTI